MTDLIIIGLFLNLGYNVPTIYRYLGGLVSISPFKNKTVDIPFEGENYGLSKMSTGFYFSSIRIDKHRFYL